MAEDSTSSEVRSALAIRAAVDDLMRPGREGGLLHDVVGPVETIMLSAKDLRPAKLTEVVEHLRAAYPLEWDYGKREILYDGEPEDEQPDDPRSPGGDDDPRAVAEALRDQVRQS